MLAWTTSIYWTIRNLLDMREHMMSMIADMSALLALGHLPVLLHERIYSCLAYMYSYVRFCYA